jgi:superfamily II DNA or RNA helicase
MSVLPNRKAFADYITRIFLKYRKQGFDGEDEDADMCSKQGQSTSQELLPYQKLVRDYLLIETPYRGLLVYHGLGSGKTCSAIGVAESLLSTKKVFVMLPASLQNNFRQQLRKCGDPIYMQNNHWEVRNVRNEADKSPAFALGITDAFLRSQARYFVTVDGKAPNYNTLPLDIRKGIDLQISDMIDSRYTFINYNGLNSDNVKLIVPEEDPTTSKTFHNSVVIIDEAHNLISRVINKSDIARRIYDAIYHATDCKVVALSGTPVINRPNEVAFLMNLLRGPIELIYIQIKEF